MTHSSTCTGCPRCNSVFAALVNAPVREQAIFNQRMTDAENARLAARTLTANCDPNTPPDPPSLVDTIAGRHIETAPVFGRGPAPRTLAANTDEVPEPPSLSAAILASRRK